MLPRSSVHGVWSSDQTERFVAIVELAATLLRVPAAQLFALRPEGLVRVAFTGPRMDATHAPYRRLVSAQAVGVPNVDTHLGFARSRLLRRHGIKSLLMLPVVGTDGFNLGTLVVMDTEVRNEFTPTFLETHSALAVLLEGLSVLAAQELEAERHERTGGVAVQLASSRPAPLWLEAMPGAVWLDHEGRVKALGRLEAGLTEALGLAVGAGVLGVLPSALCEVLQRAVLGAEVREILETEHGMLLVHFAPVATGGAVGTIQPFEAANPGGALPAMVFQQVPLAVAVSFLDGWVTDSNAAFCALFALKPGQRFNVLQFEDAQRLPTEWPWLLELLSGQKTQYSTTRELEDATGQSVAVQVTVGLLPHPQGSRLIHTVLPAQTGGALDAARQEAINQERLRLARELHDGLGKDLFGLALLLEAVAERQQGRAVQHDLLQYAGAARRLANEGRHLLNSFRTTQGALLGAVRELIARSERENDPVRPIRYRLETDEPLPQLDENTLYEIMRVAQEALRNAKTHAQAKTITVRVWHGAGRLHLEVEDDGRGLPAPLPPERYGLVGMRERASLLGGDLTLRAGAVAGLIVSLSVPMLLV